MLIDGRAVDDEQSPASAIVAFNCQQRHEKYPNTVNIYTLSYFCILFSKNHDTLTTIFILLNKILFLRCKHWAIHGILSIKGQQVNPGSEEHNEGEKWRKQIRYS